MLTNCNIIHTFFYIFDADCLLHTSWVPVFEGLDQDAFAAILRQFYAEVRKVDGTTYSRSALTNIRASLQCHVSGRDISHHKEALAGEDLVKL